MTYEEILADHVEYIMKSCGSDAGEKQNPGSKLQTQIEMITEFIEALNDLFFNTSHDDLGKKLALDIIYKSQLKKWNDFSAHN